MTIVSAWETAGGIQVNRVIGEGQLESVFLQPDDPAWLDAVAALGAAPQPEPTHEEPLEAARIAAYASVNRVRGEIRTRWITDIPGQQLVYAEKERSAREWVAARAAATDGTVTNPDLADYPAISAEIGYTAESADQVAQVYLNAASAFRQISAVIEGVSMAAFARIDAATSAADARAVATAFPNAVVAALSTHGVFA